MLSSLNFVGNMDIIELPGDLTPPDTDVVDLAVRAADTTTTTNANNNNITDNNNITKSVNTGDTTPPVSKTSSTITNLNSDNENTG